MDKELYEAYVRELSALDEFAVGYAGLHPTVPLSREDPDVRRLIESLAFFTARTRLATLRNKLATRTRLFARYFSYLTRPMPSMAVLQARPTARQAEVVVLPRGSDVAIEAEGGPTGLYQTAHDLRVLPIEIADLELRYRGAAGFRLVLTFEGRHRRGDEPGTISILVNHLANYFASLKLHGTLARNLEAASVVYDEDPTDEAIGTPCKVVFGPRRDPLAPSEADFGHPIAQVREFFHFAEAELYLHVDVPPSPRPWKRFSLLLDLASTWPRNLRPSRDAFQLFTVPIVNCRRAMGNALEADGTADRFAIAHPDLSARFRPLSVLGAYKRTEKGLEALRLGLLPGGKGSYEVERAGAEGGQDWLILNLPSSFEEPATILVEALWYQPWFSEHLGERLRPYLVQRHFPGLSWSLVGDVRPHVENPIARDPDGLVHLLALKMKPTLDLEELEFVLSALGVLHRSYFKELPNLLTDLPVASGPGYLGRSLSYIYRAGLREFDPGDEAVAERFLSQVHRLLEAWTFDAVVELEARSPSLERPYRFRPRTTP